MMKLTLAAATAAMTLIGPGIIPIGVGLDITIAGWSLFNAVAAFLPMPGQSSDASALEVIVTLVCFAASAFGAWSLLRSFGRS